MFARFADFKRRSIVWQLFAANSLDMTRSLGLAVLLAVMQYAPPMLFNKMLVALSSGSSTARREALGFVLLVLIVMVADAVIDLQQRACSLLTLR